MVVELRQELVLLLLLLLGCDVAVRRGMVVMVAVVMAVVVAVVVGCWLAALAEHSSRLAVILGAQGSVWFKLGDFTRSRMLRIRVVGQMSRVDTIVVCSCCGGQPAYWVANYVQTKKLSRV